MRLSKLHLLNFRNYGRAYFEPDPGMNLLIGPNAIGKTNLLESIYLLVSARSFRTVNAEDMIKKDRSESVITGLVEDGVYEDRLEIHLKREAKNTYAINEEKFNSRTYQKDYNAVVFTPQDLNMVRLGPQERRWYLDTLLETMSPMYRYHLRSYKKFLFERNKLLKNPKLDLLDVYDFQLSNLGAKLLKERLQTVKILEDAAKVHYKKISGSDSFKVTYLSTLKLNSNLESNYLEVFKTHRHEDLLKKTTTHGIHRDDIDFYINDFSAKHYASQGEVRSILLALKLAEMDILEQTTKKKPLLLLDDVFSELDRDRAGYLIDSLHDVQCFITSTNLNSDNFTGLRAKVHKMN
ncbi:DNA replication/repair protein RecF [Peptoniphilus equinus]|uniref:DNA replication and repair protein RecF n=1 Tax=Peptoniphilus equinus TaxID=3016343 RepID=A0ABY7QT90_9FIRM|nr:DNA replication/repair protein RecF [Peptoniphilus equinus]WBW49989.1 DNA replication/repair protein RecF [Peptoniphilus equinus]